MGGICDKHGHLLTSRQKTYNFLAQKWRASEVGRWGRIGEVGRWAGSDGSWQVGRWDRWAGTDGDGQVGWVAGG